MDTNETAMDATHKQQIVLGLWGVRYQVKDVQRSIAFYTQILGFHLDMQALPAFGQVSVGELKLILSGPGASGSRPMPDGSLQEPGGWNRIVLQVKDLPARIAELKNLGVHFRNAIEVGPGGKQIQVEDPDGNPIELVRMVISRTPNTSSSADASTPNANNHKIFSINPE